MGNTYIKIQDFHFSELQKHTKSTNKEYGAINSSNLTYLSHFFIMKDM